MIYFKRNENKVIVQVEHGVFYNDLCFELEIQQTYGYQAELLKEAFRKNLDSHLKKLKAEYYEQGHKDAKAKRKKRTDFYGGWEK